MVSSLFQKSRCYWRLLVTVVNSVILIISVLMHVHSAVMILLVHVMIRLIIFHLRMRII